jgi:hypothetical protein
MQLSLSGWDLLDNVVPGIPYGTMGREATKSKKQLIDDIAASILESPNQLDQFNMTPAQVRQFEKVAVALLATEGAIMILLAIPHPAPKIVAIVLQALLVAYAIQGSVEESHEAAAAATEWWIACNDHDKNPEAHAARITRAASAFARLVYHLLQAIINAIGAVAATLGMKKGMKGLSEGESPAARRPGQEPAPGEKPAEHAPKVSSEEPISSNEPKNAGEHATGHLSVPDNSELTNLGSAPSGKGQLTKAGHSLSKHGAGKRSGSSVFPDPTGTPASINQQALQLLRDIVSDSSRVVKQRLGRPGEHLLQISRPDGSGAIYKWDGSGWSFSHFAENLF